MNGPACTPAAIRRRLTARARALLALWPALLPPLAFIPFVLAPPLTADGGAVLDFARRWLDGGRLYVDLIDVNPPLIFVLNLIPAALARATGMDAVLALQASLVALTFWLWRLAFLVRDRAGEAPVERLTLDVLPGLMGFGAGYLFGERETLMVSAALPYLLAAARREGGAAPRARCITAMVAATGFALKPHFLLIPLMVELAVLAGRWRRLGAAVWRESLRDPVPWLMAALWLLYAATVTRAFPDYHDRIVPLARQYYLGSPDLTAIGLLLRPGMAVGAALLAAGSWIAWRRPWRAQGASPRLLALAGAGALASALLQHAGWGQHVLAVQLFALALTAVLAARLLDRAGAAHQPNGTARAAGMLSALFAVACVQLGRAPLVELHYPASDDARLARLIRTVAPGGRVMALSSGVPLFPAASYAGAVAVQRFMDLWLLQGLYQTCPTRYRGAAEMSAAERWVYQGMAEDFARARPALVLVDSRTGIPDCGGRFDYLAYFTRNPLFAATWREYRLAEAWGHFEIYVRK